METAELIGVLARTVRPVKRLPSPGLRALIWLALSLAYTGAVLLAVGARPDIAAKLKDARFLVETGAAFATAILAAMAAFCAGCPGHPRLARLAPLPALLLWLASLGMDSWKAWAQVLPDNLVIAFDPLYLSGILLIGAVPGLLIFAMIRQGAPMAPAITMALAALATTALGAATLRLLDPQDAIITVMMCQFGSAALLSTFGALSGRRLLRWPQQVIGWAGVQTRMR